jgi:hypothetical protein
MLRKPSIHGRLQPKLCGDATSRPKTDKAVIESPVPDRASGILLFRPLPPTAFLKERLPKSHPSPGVSRVSWSGVPFNLRYKQ